MKQNITLLLLLLSQLVLGQRNEVKLDDNWLFAVGNFADPSSISSWEQINLPYDYSMEAGYNSKNAPQNAWLPSNDCWFRKTIVETLSGSSRAYLWFDGAYMDSEVYVNDHWVGERPYGFISFYYDITDYLHGGENQIDIHLKNGTAPTARFYHGNSIYGDVRLIHVPEIHIPISGGVFYQVKMESPEYARLFIQTEILNKAAESKKISVSHILYDVCGKEVARTGENLKFVDSGHCDTVYAKLQMACPILWDTDRPYLYYMETKVFANGCLIDSVTTNVGVRTIDYKVESGFYLNGKHVKLQGVCEHMEMLPVGLAVPEDLWRKRIKMLKSMGCNAIRTAHNPFPPVFYRLCDELGMMVVDELFDGWKRKGADDYGGRYFIDWWRKDVESFVRRDRNHPCVIMWSIGNETGSTDVHHITEEIHRYDRNTRPTSGGNVIWGTDISGFTGQGGMPGALEKFHKEHPERAVVLLEVPHTLQTRGFYRVPAWWRDKGGAVNEIESYGTEQIFFDGHPRYRSSYDNCAVRINARPCWKRTRDTPWIIGEFRWTGYECFGEAQFMGIEYPKRSYNAGIIDLAGFPKDHYFFYKSQWTKEPMVHLLPHWTHPELKRGTEIPVVAYSNCDEVELFLNGRSLGSRRVGKLLDFVWKVPYQPGEIKAVGYRDGKICVTTSYKTASDPVALRLETDMAFKSQADKKVSCVSILALDKDNNFVPWACNKVKFCIEGKVKVLGFENGNPIDSTCNKAYERTLFYGLARGFFQNLFPQDPVRITAGSILGDTLFTDNTIIAIHATSVQLRGYVEQSKFDIYYTLDGSTPTLKSKRYLKPFTVDSSVKVKAAIYRKHEQILSLEETFTRGIRRKIIDSRLCTDEMLKDNFTGPFDKEIIGRWFCEKDQTTYFFDKKGKFFRFVGDGYHPELLGQWWYDYPNDEFENPSSTGKGEIKLEKNNIIVPISLKSGNNVLIFNEKQEKELYRVE